VRRVALALRLLAGRTGPISILYGTEIALMSGNPPRKNVDESSRVYMNWDEIDAPLVGVFRCVMRARRTAPALAVGETLGRAAIGGLFVELKRAFDGTRVLSLLNFASYAMPAGTDVSSVFAESADAEALCGGDLLELDSGVLRASIPPYGGGLYLV
jgi:hypothetical protein